MNCRQFKLYTRFNAELNRSVPARLIVLKSVAYAVFVRRFFTSNFKIGSRLIARSCQINSSASSFNGGFLFSLGPQFPISSPSSFSSSSSSTQSSCCSYDSRMFTLLHSIDGHRPAYIIFNDQCLANQFILYYVYM